MSAAPQAGAGRRVALALCLLGAFVQAPQALAQVAPASSPAPAFVVSPGMSATELAVDQVPPGTTIDQFLLALYRANPHAFLGGDIHRLLANARVRLPSADEANRLPLDQAREQLGRLQHQPAPGLAEANPSASSPAEAAPASATAELPSPASSAPAPEAPPAAPVAPPKASTDSSLWLALAAAVLAILGLVVWRRRSTPEAAPTPAPAPTVHSGDLEQQAQGRFRPVLPDDKPRTPKAPTPAAQPAPAKPALFDLDLSLDSPASDLPAPAAGGAMKLPALPELTLGKPATPATTKASAPGPLDLGAISLDLGPTPKAKPAGPLDLSGLSLDLDDKNKPTP